MIKIEDIGDVRQFQLARSFLGKGYYFTAAYLVDGLLIDSGCEHTRPELMQALRNLGVAQVVNTHSHEDHIGANADLRKEFGARVMAHSRALPVLENPRELQPLRLYQKLMWGWPEASAAEPVGEWIKTPRYSFKVVETPGHADDHICIFEPDHGWLFTGDAFVGGRDRALRADYDIWGIIRSLETMAALKPRVLFTCSGRVRNNAAADIAEKIGYLKDLGQKVLDLHGRGLSYREIRDRILGRELPIRYITFGHFSGINLVRSYVEDRPAVKEKQDG